MKVTTFEIVQRAKRLASLDNSNFYSGRDFEQALNDSYDAIYQMIIDSGDKSFNKTVSINSGRVLPFDCRQVLSASINGIPLRANEYEIRANTFYLKNGQVGSAKIEYAKERKWLYFTDNKIKSVTFDYNLFTGNRYENDPIGINYSGQGIPFENGYLQFDDTRDTLTLYHFNNSAIRSWTKDTSPFIIEGDTVSYHEFAGTPPIDNCCIIFTDKLHEGFYFVDNAGAVYAQTGKQLFNISDFSRYFCRGDGLYCISSSIGLVRYLGEVRESFVNAAIVPVAFLNEREIYGGGVVCEFGFNSIIDMPSNTFYQCMAYSIAIEVLGQQGIDASLLIPQYQSAMLALDKTLQKNSNPTSTVRDVYGAGGRVWFY